MIVNDWNAWLGSIYGVEIKADVDSIPAIAEKRLSMWQMADQSRDLTINERRALKGYGPIDGGDVLFVSAAEIPLSMASEQILPPEPISPELVKAMVYGQKTD
jgi:hypothetical protein